MNIRPARESELPRLMELFDIARAYMRRNGNTVQWVNGYPSEDLIRQDIAQDRAFVVEEDGLLPVEWNGRILCQVTESGAVRYDPTWVDTSRAKVALAQVTEAAGTVMEYMTLLENAAPLKADGLADGYRVLAEFNGTVLAGTETLLGAQFVTWARDYDRSGVNNGHYYMEDYQTAKEDFTFRSGLMAREQVFDRERLEELRQAAQDMSVHRLLWHLYNQLNVLGVFGAMDGGGERRENLIALFEHARRFESSGYRGVFAFVTQLRRLLEAGREPETVTHGSGGGVRLMSIHKSKGLEFPIVILADLSKKFSTMDFQTPVLVHPDLGGWIWTAGSSIPPWPGRPWSRCCGGRAGLRRCGFYTWP